MRGVDSGSAACLLCCASGLAAEASPIDKRPTLARAVLPMLQLFRLLTFMDQGGCSSGISAFHLPLTCVFDGT